MERLNKKYLSIFIGILAITLISGAIITHYALIKTDIEVIQPISVEGNLVQDLSLIAGTGMFGDKITISNIADWDIDVQVVSDNIEEEISVRYCYSENEMGFPLDCIDYFSNDIILTLNNESIDIYPNYFANPLLDSGTTTITTSVNPIA